MTEAEAEAEIARLHRFCLALAERIAAASEVLGKVAEKKIKHETINNGESEHGTKQPQQRRPDF